MKTVSCTLSRSLCYVTSTCFNLQLPHDLSILITNFTCTKYRIQLFEGLRSDIPLYIPSKYIVVVEFNYLFGTNFVKRLLYKGIQIQAHPYISELFMIGIFYDKKLNSYPERIELTIFNKQLYLAHYGIVLDIM